MGIFNKKAIVLIFLLLIPISLSKKYCSTNNTLTEYFVEYIDGKEKVHEINYHCEYGCFNSTLLLPYPSCYVEFGTYITIFYLFGIGMSIFLMFLTKNRISHIIGSLMLIIFIAIGLGFLLKYPLLIWIFLILVGISIYRIFNSLT